MTAPREIDRVSSSEYRKVVLASVFSTIIEWYDFLIYGTAAALVFNKLFFSLLRALGWNWRRRDGPPDRGDPGRAWVGDPPGTGHGIGWCAAPRGMGAGAMSALTFDPWAALDLNRRTCSAPNPTNPPNPPRLPDAKLDELGALGGERGPILKSALWS
jgi:hypothetical protein